MYSPRFILSTNEGGTWLHELAELSAGGGARERAAWTAVCTDVEMIVCNSDNCDGENPGWGAGSG